MSKAQDEISELMALQRQAEKKRPRSRKEGLNEEDAPSETSSGADDSKTKAESSSQDSSGGPISGLEEKMQELSENIESAVAEIEEAAKDQPVLVSLVAFTLGLVIGQSFSRR